MDQFLQAVVNSLALGGFYAIMALGFSIIWGVMGIINLAHGEFLMIGAYLTWLISQFVKWEPVVFVLFVFPIMFLLGYVIQLFLINRIVEKPPLISLLVTYSLSIIIANVLKYFFSGTPRSVNSILGGFLRLGNVTIPIVKTILLFTSIIMMIGLTVFLNHSRLGKSIRAASQNREVAKIVGIEIPKVFALTFAICISLTGAAGALFAPIQPISPFMGQPFTLKAFAITALSGFGSVRGILISSVLLSTLEVFVAIYIPSVGTNLGVVVAYLVLVIVLIFRPQGIFKGLKAMENQ